MDVSPDNLIPIRALKDNYIWILLETSTKKAFVVDPGDAEPVINALNQLGYSLAGILITHHHWDHTGGIDELIRYENDISIVGSHRSTIKTINQPVKDGDKIHCLNFDLTAMEIPGHTLDHTAYHINGTLLFSGDTLFSAGCGRIFEGTPEMMYASLMRLMQLNNDTKLYCGHEYTLNNLRFAEIVEPNNPAIQKKIREINGCSLPSTLHDEKLFNPFLRCHLPDVVHAAEKYSGKKLFRPVDVFTVLREWKNNF